MSQISRDDVAHLARLARLTLTDGELDAFAGQLDAILAHVSRIQAVDVTGVQATDNPLSRRAGAQRPGDVSRRAGAQRPGDVSRRAGAQRPGDVSRRAGAQRPGDVEEDVNVTRPDAVVPSLTQEQALASAPKAVDGRFAVPRILGEEQ